MAKYYYLISSLPMLSLENEPAISYQDFLSRCREQLSDSDFKELEKAVFSKTDGARHPLMRRWEHYINDVNSILKDERSRKLGWETEGFSNVNNPALRDRIHRASFSMNPLEGEKEILAIYFDFLDSCGSSDPFDVEALMIYALKIQIIERMNVFDMEKGRREFRRLFSSIQKQFE